MFAVTVEFEIKAGQIDVFLPLMVENARTSRETEPGCQQFDVCQDADRIFLYEIYDDRAAFETHLATPHFKRFDAASADLIAQKTLKTYESVTR